MRLGVQIVVIFEAHRVSALGLFSQGIRAVTVVLGPWYASSGSGSTMEIVWRVV